MTDDDGRTHVCKKCGEKFYMMPESHGHCFMTFYPSEPQPTVHCDGEVVPILRDDE